MRRGERDVVLSGVGQSAVGRRLGRHAVDLTTEAIMVAVADAGLSLTDIDGIATWPGARSSPPGFSPVGVADVVNSLRIQPSWFSGGSESPGQLGAVINAVAAVSAGLARHVVVFRTLTESSAQTTEQRASVMGTDHQRVAGFARYLAPLGAMSAATWVGLLAQHHMSKYGTTREQLGAVPLTFRAHAAANPHAVYREPLTMLDYLGARTISSPLGLYDCDVPVDASTAVVISSTETLADLRRPPVRIEAVGSRQSDRGEWFGRRDLATMAAHDAAAMMWERTDLRPSDVDVGCLYDGFSMLTLLWLEALGFCGRGESGAFVEGGTRIARGGEIPLNPHGGQLSAGRTHGFGLLHEACLQLWGEAGERQVRKAEVAVAAAGGGPLGGCLLLTRG